MKKFRSQSALSRAVILGVVIVIVIIIVGAGYFALNAKTSSTLTSNTTSSSSIGSSSSPSLSTSISSSSSASTGGASSSSSNSVTGSSATSSATSIANASVPSSLTWEDSLGIQFPDPHVSSSTQDYTLIENVYEQLFWFYQANSTDVIPWLASNFTVSPDLKTITINLRQGVTYADGEQFNSTGVYFSLNRMLIIDGSNPLSHGNGYPAPIQELLNPKLSSSISGAQSYNATWVNNVLAQNFVTITGPYTLQLNFMHPSGDWEYYMTYPSMVAPDYIMQNDIALWKHNGYTLPYPTL